MVHPVPLLFNTARAEDPNVEYLHYTEGISPSIAAYIERLDSERMALGQKFNISSHIQIGLNEDQLLSFSDAPSIKTIFKEDHPLSSRSSELVIAIRGGIEDL